MKFKLIRAEKNLFLIDTYDSNLVAGQYFYHSGLNEVHRCIGRSNGLYEYYGSVGNRSSFSAECADKICLVVGYYPLDNSKELELPLLPDPIRDIPDSFSFEDIKETLRIGVNIGMQNVEKPEHIDHFNFNLENSIIQCEEYIDSFKFPKEFIPETRSSRMRYNIITEEYERHEFVKPYIILINNYTFKKGEVKDQIKGYYVY